MRTTLMKKMRASSVGATSVLARKMGMQIDQPIRGGAGGKRGSGAGGRAALSSKPKKKTAKLVKEGPKARTNVEAVLQAIKVATDAWAQISQIETVDNFKPFESQLKDLSAKLKGR